MSKLLEICPYEYKGETNPKIKDIFEFELDHFQKYACDAIDENKNVFITAHTGSGKSVCFEYALNKAILENTKIVYISPIKALSNQKYHEFKEKHPDLEIGILTGDIKINPDAQLVIITAEIFRNALYCQDREIKEDEYQFNPKLVKYVVLDEIHYINDKDRGKVWEEIIMMIPKDICLIMLSATVDSPEKLAGWIAERQDKKTILAGTKTRPVPLKFYLYTDDKMINFCDSTQGWIKDKWPDFKFVSNFSMIHWINHSISYLDKHNFLPCIYFILSKREIEDYVTKITGNFLKHEELISIKDIWRQYIFPLEKQLEKLDEFYKVKQLVERGIAYHHSSMVPQLKEVIEILYGKGLIKVLLATETFAVGINAPTKSIVFAKLTKYDNNGLRNLYSQEFNQMAGRAGRRGLDKFGNVFLLSKFLPKESEVKSIIMGKPITLKSRLNLDYSYFLRMFRMVEKKEEFMEFLINQTENSFFEKENQISYQSIRKELDNKKNEIDKLDYNQKDFEEYQDLQNKLDNQLMYSQSKVKKFLKKFKTIKNKEVFEKALKLSDKITSLTEIINNNYLVKHFNYLKDFLELEGFIKNDLLTKMGLIASEINQINPLVISYLIVNNCFDKISFHELVAFISLFLEGKKTDDYVLSELEEEFGQIELIYQTLETMDYYHNVEVELNNNLPYPFSENYHLSYDNYSICYHWANGKTWKELGCNIYEGDFVKVILRIHQILRELSKGFELLEKYDQVKMIEDNQDSLIREIVILDSLYL